MSAAPAPDHVADYAYLGHEAKRRHLIRHGTRLDLLPPMTDAQMATLHAMLHAGSPPDCPEVM